MSISFWSPLPPEHTGVADYSATLLEELTKLTPIATNPRSEEASPGDIDVYHIGNNGFHAEAYHWALAQPGVAVIHDAVLQHFFLGYMSREEYIEEFVYNYGEWYRPFAETLWRDRERAPSDARYFDWPMLRRLAETSLGLIVHNPAAEAVVLRHAPNARTAVIPHLFQPVTAPEPGKVAQLRAGWGVPPDTLLIGLLGYLRETKRVPQVLRAFERARLRGAKLALLVAGEFVSKNLEQTLAARLGQPGIVRHGYVAEEEFWLQAHAVDACINLRVPSAAESSGITTRLMGIGRALFLTEGPELAHLPAGSYVPISPGANEESEIEEMFVTFAGRPALAREMGALARQHTEAEHAVKQVAARYLAFIKACRAKAMLAGTQLPSTTAAVRSAAPTR